MADITPGPWVREVSETTLRLLKLGRGEAAVSSEGGHWYGLATVNVELEGEPSPEGEANLRAILAVPEMINALRAAVEWFTRCDQEDVEVVNLMRSALRKATGGSA